jgi:hypothetical protein
MTTEVLKEKTGRYLRGESVPSEVRQIQTWLSCINDIKANLTAKEKENIENEIIAEVQAYIAYSQFNPKPEPWWKKIKVNLRKR